MWFQSNKLALNIGKTKFILIHRRRQEIKLQLKINGTTLEQTDQIKYLGVIIDHKLNWKPHITNCTNKLGKCLWAITKLRPYTNIEILKLVYYSLAYPQLQYCVSSWGGATHTSLQPLLVKQKLIIKSMPHQNYMSRSSPLFLKLDILKLPEIYKLQIGKLMKKQIVKYTSQNILPISTVHSHNTRSSSKQNYFIPSVKSNIGKTSFNYYGPIVWNRLPNDIKTASEFRFKYLLKKYLINQYLSLSPSHTPLP